MNKKVVEGYLEEFPELRKFFDWRLTSKGVEPCTSLQLCDASYIMIKPMDEAFLATSPLVKRKLAFYTPESIIEGERIFLILNGYGFGEKSLFFREVKPTVHKFAGLTSPFSKEKGETVGEVIKAVGEAGLDIHIPVVGIGIVYYFPFGRDFPAGWAINLYKLPERTKPQRELISLTELLRDPISPQLKSEAKEKGGRR